MAVCHCQSSFRSGPGTNFISDAELASRLEQLYDECLAANAELTSQPQ